MTVFHSIRARILFTHMAILLITILVLGRSSYLFLAKSLCATQEQQLQQFAGHFADNINIHMERISQHLKVIANSRDVEVYAQNRQPPMLNEYFSKNFRPFSSLSYLNEDGVEEVKVVKGSVSTMYRDLGESEIVRRAQSTPNTVLLSAPFYCQETGAPVLQAAVLQQGYFHDEFIGIIVGTVELDWLKHDMTETTIGKTGFFRLIDQNGTVMLSPYPEEILNVLQTESGNSVQTLMSKSGVMKTVFNGLDGFVASSPVPQAQWSILATLPINEFSSGLQQLKKTIILLAVILFFAGFVLAFFLSGQITKPIRRLINAAESVGKGDFSQTIPITRRDEMGTLAESFNTMTGELMALRQKDNALRKEKEEAEKRMHRAEKMEAIGLMAGGVAHDLNNILSGLTGYPELLLMQLPEDSKLRKPLEDIKDSGERAVAVVSDLLTVARGVASIKSVTCLNTLLAKYLDSPEYRHLLSLYPEVRFEQRLADGLPCIFCSPVHIKKCIMNLATNAAESIERSGSIMFSTSTVTPDLQLSAKSGLEEKEYVVLTVTDTGTGISEEDIQHIFEPFYTKKVMDRSGTGLGLAVLWNTMKDHNGMVTVSSSDQGSSFTLYFPATTRDLLAQSESVERIIENGNRETIMVVDDEPLLRNIAGSMLEALGYTVISMSSGEEAVAYLREHRVDLVLLDMLMEPGINGRQTYEQILKLHPGQKALVTSGFSADVEVDATLRLGASGFVTKPYSMEDLGVAVKQGLI